MSFFFERTDKHFLNVLKSVFTKYFSCFIKLVNTVWTKCESSVLLMNKLSELFYSDELTVLIKLNK